ncbi:OLC1v1030177C3 [Oldenlandia corymbosa var. corymbosa]|nr:OLC1v1030177C3 [Oldenlandia corymbosa var. corymbosa]
MDERLMEERSGKLLPDSTTGKLKSLLGSVEDLEKQESEVVSRFVVEHALLQAEVDEFEGMLQNKTNMDIFRDMLDHSLDESKEKLNVLKKELASKQRTILQLHRQLDDIPVPAELLQYELCFSQLYTSIQRKLRQTRKHYDTFNALLEIKEIMLKETSLLNSISSQFQIAISSPVGRTKLVESMEKILNGIQQKLDKLQLVLEPEQKACRALKEKHRKALSDQRQCYSLLQAFEV